MIHDAAITPNWLILFIWPFEASVERMKRGGHHWAWSDDRSFTMIVVPRRANSPVAAGWKANEVRSYHFKICMPIHTGAAWEEPDGRIMIESSRVHDNAFPFFPPEYLHPFSQPNAMIDIGSQYRNPANAQPRNESRLCPMGDRSYHARPQRATRAQSHSGCSVRVSSNG